MQTAGTPDLMTAYRAVANRFGSYPLSESINFGALVSREPFVTGLRTMWRHAHQDSYPRAVAPHRVRMVNHLSSEYGRSVPQESLTTAVLMAEVPWEEMPRDFVARTVAATLVAGLCDRAAWASSPTLARRAALDAFLVETRGFDFGGLFDHPPFRDLPEQVWQQRGNYAQGEQAAAVLAQVLMAVPLSSLIELATTVEQRWYRLACELRTGAIAHAQLRDAEWIIHGKTPPSLRRLVDSD